ncbi:MAG: C40 family peptidase, partial [Lachnospiraceae bacterium]|nr:C40 family peptidase [Lachnospiraceae bacterium]
TIGEAAVALAKSRLDWSYTMDEDGREAVGSWDCSSLVYRCYNELGVYIGGTTTSTILKNVRKNHKEISESELRPGDIILIRTTRGINNGNTEGVGHVVMWAGNGQVIHAKGTNYGTVLEAWQGCGHEGGVICYARPYLGEELPERYTSTGEAVKGESWSGKAGTLSDVNVAKRIWNFLKAYRFPDGSRFTETAIAALIGNIEQESSLDPGCVEVGNNNEGYGLIQWSWERKPPFINWMKSHNYDINNVEGQCEYIVLEADFIKNYPITYSKTRKTPRESYAKSFKDFATRRYATLEDAVYDYGYCAERMREQDANWPRRIGAAYAAMELFGGKTETEITGTGKASADGSFTNGQKIYFSDFSDAEFAGESALHTGYATVYKAARNPRGITVCVNAGHGTAGGTKAKTRAHPDGSPKYVSGTNAAGETYSYAISTGTDTAGGVAEATVNLKVAVLTCSELLNRGYDVVMIRDYDNKSPVLDNIARTVIANETSDCHIAVHFDGDGLSYDKGCFYMGVPDIAAYKAMYPVSECWQKHEALGKALVNGMVKNGVKKYSSGRIANDLTQTSYSTIPSVDIEYGNQSSNFTDEYLGKIAAGLADGIDEFFGR